MSGEPERISLRCPECDYVLATVPKRHRFENELICPGCGSRVQPPAEAGDMIEGEAQDRTM